MMAESFWSRVWARISREKAWVRFTQEVDGWQCEARYRITRKARHWWFYHRAGACEVDFMRVRKGDELRDMDLSGGIVHEGDISRAEDHPGLVFDGLKVWFAMPGAEEIHV